MAIYCLNCGVSLPDGVAFCDACGTPVRGQNQGMAAASPSASPSAQQPYGEYSPPPPQGQGAAIGGAGSVACPVCGAAALPGEAFCDNCGTSLLSASGAAYPPAP